MVLNTNFFLALLSIGVLISIHLLRRKIMSFLTKLDNEIANLKKELVEMNNQQQVIYNLSTSIFLLRSVKEIISSTISEIVVMYHWSDVAYFPYDQLEVEKNFYGQPPKYSTEEVAALIKQGTDILNSKRSGEYLSVFVVGHDEKPLGGLCVGKAEAPLTEDQVTFFKTVANFLTVAIDNIQALNEQ